jgi:chemotaxis protein methyltransferase WspC
MTGRTMGDLFPAPQEEINRLLCDRLGFDPNSCGSRTIEQAVAARQRARNCPRPDAYLALLHTNADEFQALIEEVVVPETWFFRDAQPYRCLRAFARRQSLLRYSNQPLRVLSVPCSTGEETYSLAICLFELGFRPQQAMVDGVDISQRSIERARRGQYEAHSFRERDPEWHELRERYFRLHDNAWRVVDEVRELVRFRHANLTDATFLPSELPYDVIFCRNLFIYLNLEGRRRAIAHFQRLLAPDGLLYVGHSEASVLVGSDFVTCDTEFPFAFRIRQAPAAAPTLLTTPTIGLPLRPPVTKDKAAPVVLTAQVAPTAGPSPLRTPGDTSTKPRAPAVAPATYPPLAAPSSETLLNAAHAAANAGRLDDAVRACDDWLVRFQPAAAVFGLRGVVRKAQGRLDDAIEDLERALYLDPHDEQSLVHLMQVHEQRGERQRAETVRRRLARLAHRKLKHGPAK